MLLKNNLNNAFWQNVANCNSSFGSNNYPTLWVWIFKTSICAGAPNAHVSLIGVDRAAYFLYNGSRLQRNSMFEKMQSFDQGCVLHGGRNGKDVFTVKQILKTSWLISSTFFVKCGN